MVTQERAMRSLENIFDFCEEIDVHLPTEEKSGYRMFPDYQAIREYIANSSTVYILYVNDEEGNDVVEGVFSTYYNAQNFADDHLDEWYKIEKCTLDPEFYWEGEARE